MVTFKFHNGKKKAEAFSITGVSTSINRTTGLSGTVTTTTSEFTLDGHKTLSGTVSSTYSGTVNGAYPPQATATVQLITSSGSVVATLATVTANGKYDAYRSTTFSYNVSSLSGKYKIKLSEYLSVQAIYEQGQDQNVTAVGTVSTCNVSV